MIRLDSLAVVSMASFAVLWMVAVAAAPRRDRDGRGLWDLACVLAGTMLAYASAELPVFLAGWALTAVPYWRGETRGPKIAMAVSTGLVAMGALLAKTDFASAAFGLLVLAVVLRKGILPTHLWTVEAFEHLQLPTLGLVLNSHLGGYLLIRFVMPMFPTLAASWLPAVSLLALVTSVFMAVAALAETHPRRVLGFLWISQSSFILAGLATMTEEGITGALLQWWVVAFTMTGMLSVYRSLEARSTNVRERISFLGLGAHAPRLAVFFAICGLALVGLPGTLGFVAEDLLFHGALKTHPWLGVALPVATAINAISMLRLFLKLFTGKRAIHVPPIPDALPFERLALTVAVVLLVLGGLVPTLLIAMRTPSAMGLVNVLSGR